MDFPLGEATGRPVEDALFWAGLGTLGAALLLDLSRTLAERARGRWYAGNGRDLFHAGAAAATLFALSAAGFSLPLSAVGAALALAAPLLCLDALPARRSARFGILLGMVGAWMIPQALLAPQLSTALNRVAVLLSP